MTKENLFTHDETQILKRIPKTTLIISILFSLSSLFFFSFLTAIIILSGGLLSILNFFWLKDSVVKLTSFHKKKALFRGLTLYFTRFLLIFACFFIIIKISSENLLAFLIGFLSIFIAMGIEAILAVRKG